jgi:succinoglycan biosynthesis protein ExoA
LDAPNPHFKPDLETADAVAVDCSVLVPLLNEEDHIASCIAAMRGQRFDGRLEFLLVDGGSTDRTLEIVRGLAHDDDRIRLLRNPRRDIPAGLNVGLGNARGTWVARMDAHSEYPDDYLAQGVGRLRRGDTQWVSGPQVPVGKDTISRAVALALDHPLGRGGSRRWASQADLPDAEYELDSGVFCGVWKRDTLLARGGWDERWARNEDSEMAARFQERGERVICLPSMAATYRPRDSLRSLWRQYLGNGRFRARTARWHPQTMRRSNLLLPGLVAVLATAVIGPRRLRAPARAGVFGYVLTITGAGAAVAPDAERKREAALVPVVLAIMHVGYGLGFLHGVVRYGPPLAGVAAALGCHGFARRLSSPPQSVFAPSLEG